MPTEREYRERIRQCDQRGLLALWEQIEQRDTPGWEPGRAFEYLVLRAFEIEGAHVQWPFTVKLGEDLIEQVDGAVYCDGLACLIESKDQKEPVTIEAIAKLRNQLLRRPATAIGAVFSRSGFTAPARELSRFLAPQTILLWRAGELSYAVQKGIMRSGLLAKYRHAVEYGLPDFDIGEPGQQ